MNEELFPKGLSSVARPILTAILSTNPSSAKLQQVLKPKKNSLLKKFRVCIFTIKERHEIYKSLRK